MTSLDSLSTSRPTRHIGHAEPACALHDADEAPGHPTPSMRSGSQVEHDPTRLAAALDEIEARRAAIEWLLEADLLCLCLA